MVFLKMLLKFFFSRLLGLWKMYKFTRNFSVFCEAFLKELNKRSQEKQEINRWTYIVELFSETGRCHPFSTLHQHQLALS